VRDGNTIAQSLKKNVVTIMFVALCAVCLMLSGQRVSSVVFELSTRIYRNAFIVLALIIPIVAGMGINFAITIGAMAAQISMLWVLEWGIPGIAGFGVAAAMTVPIAGFFGYLIGKLLNKMKGQEMIGSMILGFFANGVYQLLFLFIFGNLIPLNRPGLVIKGSTGVANTMDLSKPGGLKYALDGLWKLRFEQALYVFAAIAVVLALVVLVARKLKGNPVFPALIGAAACFGAALIPAVRDALALSSLTMTIILAAALACVFSIGVTLLKPKAIPAIIVGCAVCVGLFQIPAIKELFSLTSVPMVTILVIALLCLFNVGIMKTRLGQQFRAVGQSRVVANASGIDVNRTRLTAIVYSTILAGIGQLIFVQNMGSFQTYGAHEQVGLYAGAAILVGGASIVRATNAQAILGCVLFHMLFLVAPPAAKNVFGDAAIGEYFRVFITYGVIALALVMHAWSSIQSSKPQNAIRNAGKA